MKNIYKIFTAIILLSVLAGCTNEPNAVNSIKPEKTIVKDNFWNLQSSDIVIAESVGKYADIYIPSDFYAVLSAQKTDPLSDVFYSSYNNISKNCRDCDDVKTQSKQANPFCVSVNGMKVKTFEDNVQEKYEKEDLSSLYGKNVKFSIQNVNHAQTQSASSSDSDSDSTAISMYVPELIEITSPAVLTKEDMYPLCYYENFILRWNSDEQNENGVAIIVTWT
jgi:hypothetical protein